MKKFKLNKCFKYSTIEKEVCDIVDIEEYGPYQIGEQFIVLRYPKDNVVSFVLVGIRGQENEYKCVYNDYYQA